ncbi:MULTISPECIES: oligosaccharide flippase family protein [Butyricimonas]|uniref:oligosaccharide flippase family protein n=1 Tax=Butyricimonas TaxID=574697 RepID=UPI00208D8147|nr:oligosaccharide flippase family protein [Butyricimonas paravirosa]BDF56854.1 hypothetical protein CE91St21_42890 [Odoribacteraceae bacterium]GKH95717.1 hypothetical protein CE91St23_42130 [Odoribacteraceae bacterium]GKH98348.1 hypothetical protein CE91St22_22260 [Odoribacteraceae bacterium]GKI00865.1 hypothetical protein CE91St24_01400 [Odoribacteraceae bacterium]
MIVNVLYRIKKSQLFKDSFWAIGGNGISYGLLLLGGIFIARFLGKDLYGEYGVIKATMFNIASVATFGLNFTSTKYIAEFKQYDQSRLKAICQGALSITLITGIILAILLFIYAQTLAIYLDAPRLKIAFQVLGIIIVLKAVVTTQSGILAGFGVFKIIAQNSMWSGVVFFLMCIPMAYWGGLQGALGALLFSQAFNCCKNYVSLHYIMKKLPGQHTCNFVKELFRFSLPIALQEISINICNLGGVFLITKLSSLGELGIYSATNQWEIFITFIPVLLSNVILSHLSNSTNDRVRHNRTMKIMLLVNFVCTLIPFIIVYCLSRWIVSWYGATFTGMASVLNVVILAAIFNCCSNVFRAEFISIGKNWQFFGIRFLRDILLLVLAYILIQRNSGENAAFYFAIAYVISSISYLMFLFIVYLLITRKHKFNACD